MTFTVGWHELAETQLRLLATFPLLRALRLLAHMSTNRHASMLVVRSLAALASILQLVFLEDLPLNLAPRMQVVAVEVAACSDT